MRLQHLAGPGLACAGAHAIHRARTGAAPAWAHHARVQAGCACMYTWFCACTCFVLMPCWEPDALLRLPCLHLVSTKWMRGRQRGRQKERQRMKGRGGGSKAGACVLGTDSKRKWFRRMAGKKGRRREGGGKGARKPFGADKDIQKTRLQHLMVMLIKQDFFCKCAW